MGDMQLTRTRIREGVWEGILTGGSAEGVRLTARHQSGEIQGVTLTPVPGEAGTFAVRLPIPPDCLNEGVQSFAIDDAATGAQLESFTIVAGDPPEQDLRAEVALLRAELDMVKRTLRRHLAEGA